MKIGTLEISPTSPVACIAELGNAHNGDFARAIRLIDAAKAAGADAVKLQAYSVADLLALRGDGPAPEPWGSAGYTMRTLYEKAQTPLDWFAGLFAHAHAIGIPIFSSVFGPDGFAVLESVGNPCYKLAALDCDSHALSRMVLSTDKPVIRSHPAEVAPTRWPMSLTLYAPPGYPQPRANLRNIRNGYDGYSYHGNDPWTPGWSVLAGARVIEAHFQLRQEPSELEANVSLDEDSFAAMVRIVHTAEDML